MKIPKPQEKNNHKITKTKKCNISKSSKAGGWNNQLCAVFVHSRIVWAQKKKFFIPILTFPLLPSVTVIGSEASKNAVLHCFALFFDVFSSVEASPVPILCRCFIYVIFEVSNAKGSLKFKFWIQKFEFWAVTARFGAKMLFLHCFCTVFRRFLVCGSPHTLQMLHICNVCG